MDDRPKRSVNFFEVPVNWRIFSHPFVILFVSWGAALGFALVIGMFFQDPARSSYLMYDVPIAAAFTVFILDRISRFRTIRAVLWFFDLGVVSLALTRAFKEVPYISGHALFLSYSLLTCRRWAVRLLAGVVLMQVIYLKFFIWHDITLAGGLLLGILAGGAYNRIARRGIKGK